VAEEEAALGKRAGSDPSPTGSFGAFAGPAFDPDDIAGYLASLAASKRAR